MSSLFKVWADGAKELERKQRSGSLCDQNDKCCGTCHWWYNIYAEVPKDCQGGETGSDGKNCTCWKRRKCKHESTMDYDLGSIICRHCGSWKKYNENVWHKKGSSGTYMFGEKFSQSEQAAFQNKLASDKNNCKHTDISYDNENSVICNLCGATREFGNRKKWHKKGSK